MKKSLFYLMSIFLITLLLTNATFFIPAFAAAPVIDPIGNKSIVSNHKLEFTITASDPDGDAVTLSVNYDPYVMYPVSFDVDPPGPNVTGTFRYWPFGSEQLGTHLVTFVAVAGGQFCSWTIEITVEKDYGPTIEYISNRTIATHHTLQVFVSAYDLNPCDPVILGTEEPTFPWNSSLPDGATFYIYTDPSPNVTGIFAWTPSPEQVGTHQVWFTAHSGENNASTDRSMFITVVENQPPAMNPIGDKQVLTGQPLSFSVTASDPENDPYIVATQVWQYWTGGAWEFRAPSGGYFINQTTHVFTWTPGDFIWDHCGKWRVVFLATDCFGYNDPLLSELVEINVYSVNVPPILDPIGDKIVNEEALLTFNVTASDSDGDAITYLATGLPVGATLDASTGSFNWTPTYDQAGSYNVMFTASDGLHGSTYLDSENITITVVDVNRPPELQVSPNYSVLEGDTLILLVDAVDPDGDNFLIGVFGTLPAGAVFDYINYVLTWTPLYTQHGLYQVTFWAQDSSAALSFATVNITVADVNGPPIIDPIGNRTVIKTQLLSFNVTASDPEGETVTFSVTGLPQGAAFDGVTGVFEWIPTKDQAGNYSVMFTASDSDNDVSETINIEVENRLSEFYPIGDKTVFKTELLNFKVYASDPDGDKVYILASGLPEGANFVSAIHDGYGEGWFCWTPTKDQTGNYSVTFTASDKIVPEGGNLIYLNNVTETINIEVKNRAPFIEPIGNKSVIAGQLLSFNVTASDPDGDTMFLNAGLPCLPENATFQQLTATTGVFEWTPSVDQALPSGTEKYTVWFFVEDSDGFVSYRPVTITVHLTIVRVVQVQNETSTELENLIDNREVDETAGNTLRNQLNQVLQRNTSPILSPIGDRVGFTGLPLMFTVIANDLDGDVVTLSVTGLPQGATFGTLGSSEGFAAGLFSWIPLFNQAGTYYVKFTASDPYNDVSETIKIEVHSLSSSYASYMSGSERGSSQPNAMVKTKSTSHKNPYGKTAAQQINVAINKLNAIMNYIEAQREKHISEYAANQLLSLISVFINLLELL